MINNDELEKYSATYSEERLSSFAYSDIDTIKNIVENYGNNMIISQSLYPELCTLEIILRNSIDNILRKYISETWIEDEINNNVWLDSSEYETLLKAYKSAKEECFAEKKQFTIGKVVANLNFGFWTNLCVKKYNSKIWNKPKCFYGVFPRYTYEPSITIIAKKLYTIRRFRNRIFHYEKIFKYPEKTLNLYNDILEMLSYLQNDDLEILKKTSTFLGVYNKLMEDVKLCNKKT
jgi:hypothetical protein